MKEIWQMWRYRPQFEIGRRESSEKWFLKESKGYDTPFLNKSPPKSSRHRDSLFFSQKIAGLHVHVQMHCDWVLVISEVISAWMEVCLGLNCSKWGQKSQKNNDLDVWMFCKLMINGNFNPYFHSKTRPFFTKIVLLFSLLCK